MNLNHLRPGTTQLLSTPISKTQQNYLANLQLFILLCLAFHAEGSMKAMPETFPSPVFSAFSGGSAWCAVFRNSEYDKICFPKPLLCLFLWYHLTDHHINQTNCGEWL